MQKMWMYPFILQRLKIGRIFEATHKNPIELTKFTEMEIHLDEASATERNRLILVIRFQRNEV